MDFSTLAQALLKKMAKCQPTVWFFSFQKDECSQNMGKQHLTHIFFVCLDLSDQKRIMEGTFPSSTLIICSLYLSLSCWDDGELTMGRALNFFTFSDQDGRRDDCEVDTMGRSCSLFLKALESRGARESLGRTETLITSFSGW